MFGSISNWDGDLFNRFERLQREMEDVMGYRNTPNSIWAVPRGSYPDINVGTTPKGVEIYLFAAGLDVENLDLTIHQNLLTVSGEVAAAQTEGDKAYLRERFRGPFRRSLTLPEDVDPESARASYQNGVLRISLARKAEAVPKKIQVN